MSRSCAFGFPPLSLKIWNKLHDISQNCLQCSSTQPRRDYHIARIHLQRAVMHSETQFSTQVRLPAPLYINLYSERPFRPVRRPPPPMKYLSEFVRIRFRFLIRHSDPFFPLQLKPPPTSSPLPQPRLLGEYLLESAAGGFDRRRDISGRDMWHRVAIGGGKCVRLWVLLWTSLPFLRLQ